MAVFNSPIALTEEQFNNLTRVDKVQWSSESFTCQVVQANDFFTSLLYSTVVSDSISVSVPTLSAKEQGIVSDELQLGFPSIEASSLEVTVVREAAEFTHQINLGMPSIEASSLTTTISRGNFSYEDSATLSMPQITAASLVVTASYLQYDILPERVNVALPQISSGVLS